MENFDLMTLPTIETVEKLLSSGYGIRDRILRIARRLEALEEYPPEQALRVAADIVAHSLNSGDSASALTGEKDAEVPNATSA